MVFRPIVGGEMGWTSEAVMVKQLIVATGVVAIGICVAQGQRDRKVPRSPIGTANQAKKLGDIEISPAIFKVVKKSTLTFIPKYLTENGMAKGTPVPPETVVHTPSGQDLKAGELVAGANTLESTLNGLGYSFYANEADTTTPILSMTSVIKDLSPQETKLRAAGGMKGFSIPPKVMDVAAEVATARKTFSRSGAIKQGAADTAKGGRPKAGDIGRNTKSKKGAGGGIPKDEIPNFNLDPKVVVKPVNSTVTFFDEEFGDPKWFSISLNSHLTKFGDMKVRKLVSFTDLDASILGKSTSIFHCKVQTAGLEDKSIRAVFAKPDNTAKVTDIFIEATLLGDDLISPVSKTTAGTLSRKVSGKSVNWEYGVKIPIIPGINIVGTVGAKGTLGLDASATADGDGGDLSVSPSISAAIYAQAGVSVSLIVASVEGGVTASLTLIDYDLDISGAIATVETQESGEDYVAVVTPITASHGLNTLKGSLSAYVKLGLWLPFKTREKTVFNGNLFSWKGFTDSKQLYSEHPTKALIGKVPATIDRSPRGKGGSF